MEYEKYDSTLPAQPAYGPAPPPTYDAPYSASQVEPHNLVIVQSHPPPLQNIRFNEHPVRMTCNNCQQQITTRVESKSSLLQWGICLAICALGGGCGCCLIPFCMDSLGDYHHDCPHCNARLGTKRM